MKSNPLKRLLGAAALGVLASFGARADDPAHGEVLFQANCTSSKCHSPTPLTSNTNKGYNARNARAAIDAAMNSVSEMKNTATLRPAFPSNGSEIADVAAYLGNSPSSLSFGATAVGTTSAPQTVTVYASYKAGYAISNLSVSTSGDFARSGGTCATSVAQGLNCTLLIGFTPTASGTRTGTLSISHSNTLTPITIALTGTGSGAATPTPVAGIAPASLALASTAIGSTSAAQNVTVSNTGTAALSISAVSLTNGADFVIAGGTCSAGTSVAAGASCTVSVAFKPAAGATGTRSGSLVITHNAAGSPGSVGLSGSATAAAAPVASLTSTLAFGSVNVGTAGTPQTATLSNTGTAPLTIASLATGSSEFVIGGGSCGAGASVAAGASCTINVGFTPSAAGARSATLTVAHDAGAGSSSTTLSGTGIALSPAIGVSPATLAFSQTVGTVSAAQSATISNTGNAQLTIAALALGGAQAADYQLASGTTCTAGGSVAANASCVIRLVFAPTASGARNASLNISHNAPGASSSITLNGTGTATPQPAISLNASALSFAAQTLGSTSTAQSVTIVNGGSAPLTLSALTLAGTASGDFARGGSCSTGTAIAVGASCTVTFTFTPGAVGARSATLTLVSDASNGNAALSLSGTGAALPTPAVTLAPGALAFGNQASGVTSTARTVTLSNSGSGALAISGITASAGFGVSQTCGASLAAGASCILSVSFTPSALGAASGTVSVASNAAGSPHTVTLSGTGVAASPVLAWSPATATLAFGDVGVGASPSTRTLTLVNQGPGAVTLQQLTLSGLQATEFALDGSGSCSVGSALAQGASCTLVVAFQPGAAGARMASLQVASSGSNPPDVALSGNGTALAQSAVMTMPSALNFTVTATGTAVAAQTLTLQNQGSSVLHVTALRISSAGAFTIAAAPTNSCTVNGAFDLMPGQSCAVTVSWASSAPGTESGTLEIDTSAAATPMQVALQAVRDGSAGATPVATNAGQGGCSIARGESIADPTLWLLALLAAGVLLRRGHSPRPHRS